MIYYWIGQIIGVIAMIESFFIFQVSERKKMVILKLVDDFLWVIHFLLIGGYTGALTTSVAVIREIIFYYKGSKKWANSKWWAIGFSFIFLLCSLLTWTNVFSLLPALASSISTWVFWVDETKHAKIIQIPCVILMFIYCIVCSSYSGILTQLITLISIIIYFIRLLVKRREKHDF